ncbi:MAG: hypothetical protein HRU17_10655 [Polyangiaceae bacterium]|nr:hypothetical protein [Polyangiaceae bacterium]
MPQVQNLALALFLVATCAGAYSANANDLHRIDFLLYGAATAILVVNTARRSPALTSDDRLWVSAVCAVSSVYYLAFEAGPVFSAVLVLHVLGDLSLIYLGRSFAIFPARRELRLGGLYSYVRHPAYASYIATDLMFVVSSPSLRNGMVAAVGISLLLVRVHLEERLLNADPNYQRYCESTRYRLLPGIY